MFTSTRHLVPFIMFVVALAAATVPAQESLQLLPPGASDLVAAELQVPLMVKDAATIERQPVSYSWALPGDQPLDLAARPATASSRSYHLQVGAAELAAGVELPIVSAGAFVRINPLTRTDSASLYAIDPLSLEIVAGGEIHRAGSAMVILADDDQMKAAGSPFPAGTSAFRLHPELGSGPVVLRAPQLEATDPTPYLIGVLEPDSTVTLELTADRNAYLVGQQLTATVVLGDGDSDKKLPIGQVELFLVKPESGERQELEPLRSAPGTVTVQLRLNGDGGPHGLWQLHARVSGRLGKLQVRRDVHTAFGCALPTARFTGLVTVLRPVKSGLPALVAELGVDVAVAGRYEVRGVLFGTGPLDKLQPLAAAQSATWLEAGQGSLVLRVDGKVLAASSLQAPFEVRDLRLLDQGRMGLLHRQALGFAIGR